MVYFFCFKKNVMIMVVFSFSFIMGMEPEMGQGQFQENVSPQGLDEFSGYSDDTSLSIDLSSDLSDEFAHAVDVQPCNPTDKRDSAPHAHALQKKKTDLNVTLVSIKKKCCCFP